LTHHPTSLPQVRLHPLRDNKFFNYLFPYCCCRDGYQNHTTRRREELEVIELPAKGENAKGTTGRKKGTNKTRGSMESSHIHKRPVLLTFMAMAERARYNGRLAGVFNAEIQASFAQSFASEEREKEREEQRACLRACTNPNPSPIVRSDDPERSGTGAFLRDLTDYELLTRVQMDAKSVIVDVLITSMREHRSVHNY
jgi:hypothetical protein